MNVKTVKKLQKTANVSQKLINNSDLGQYRRRTKTDQSRQRYKNLHPKWPKWTQTKKMTNTTKTNQNGQSCMKITTLAEIDKIDRNSLKISWGINKIVSLGFKVLEKKRSWQIFLIFTLTSRLRNLIVSMALSMIRLVKWFLRWCCPIWSQWWMSLTWLSKGVNKC